jgi:hypothetical protein
VKDSPLPVHFIVRNIAIFRFMSLTACLAWGILELVALQKSRWLNRRGPVRESLS